MKKIVTIVIGLSIAWLIAYHFVGPFLTERHTITKSDWELPSESNASLNDELAIKVITYSLTSISEDSSLWKPLPLIALNQTNILQKRKNGDSGKVTLSNTVNGTIWFANVDLDKTNRVVHCQITSAK